MFLLGSDGNGLRVKGENQYASFWLYKYLFTYRFLSSISSGISDLMNMQKGNCQSINTLEMH